MEYVNKKQGWMKTGVVDDVVFVVFHDCDCREYVWYGERERERESEC